YVLALDVAGFVEALAERGGKGWIGRSGIDESDDRYRRLLRPRRERPHCRAAEKGDEIATPHGAYPKAKDHGLSIAGLAGSVACIATKSAGSCPVWVNCVGGDQSGRAAYVRFAPESGQIADVSGCQLCANSVLTRRSKKHRYSITSSAMA